MSGRRYKPTAEKRRRRKRRVFMRDRWICQLCGDLIDPMLEAPHPMSATVDHIVPWGQGGMWTVENMRAAHRRCNNARHDHIERAA